MHILTSAIMILGAIIILVLGLVSVLQDLVDREPMDMPLLSDDDPAWQSTSDLAASRNSHQA